MADLTCADCKFYQNLGEGRAGECRRYPPVRRFDELTQRTISQFPSTEPNDWCGEFSSKTAEHEFY